jgi:RNA methyltransferase, TrmH family
MKESKVYGLNAAIQFAKQRPEQIIRAYYTKENIKHFQKLQQQLAKLKKPYRVVGEEDLEKLSQSKHHEGVCFVVQAPTVIPIETWLKSQPKDSTLLVLENIGNPHNLGAIVRICSHFGIHAIASSDPKALFSGAAMRTAEGGAEYIQAVGYLNLKTALKKLKQSGYQVLTTSSHKGTSIYSYSFPQKIALVFGAEADGLSKEAFSEEDARLLIPGSGNIESLNVSTAIAVILGEVWRQRTC